MSWITDIFTTAVSGGVTGLIGTVFSGVMLWRENANKRKHEIEMRRVDIEERKAEAELTMKQIEAETEATKISAELNAFNSSIQADRATYSSRGSDSAVLLFVDAVRGLVRPVLTVALVIITSIVIFDVIEAAGGYDTVIQAQSAELYADLIHALIYMTTTAVLWWFGAREVKKSIK
ncbi:TMhelix containing protein [Vibrio phage 1.215.B._10N.222.54.F7]|nr:TMhelix containing protein [Vibrio phage 1.215.A._10N.222.54.F7]AUR96110.1 TMhelix containing protein [Vibrio phage 1.215.B._10N.222.54.F7]